MIVDSHAHVVMTDDLYKYMAELVASRANPPAPFKGADEALLRKASEGLVRMMDAVGTDIQFLSPRPYMAMHSIRPPVVGATWTRIVNDAIATQCRMFPDRFRGIAGLPQFRADSPANCVDELTRCVEELGFVGCQLNPDPTEGE